MKPIKYREFKTILEYLVENSRLENHDGFSPTLISAELSVSFMDRYKHKYNAEDIRMYPIEVLGGVDIPAEYRKYVTYIRDLNTKKGRSHGKE